MNDLPHLAGLKSLAIAPSPSMRFALVAFLVYHQSHSIRHAYTHWMPSRYRLRVAIPPAEAAWSDGVVGWRGL